MEAEFDGVDEALGSLAELRPDGEDGLVLARRVSQERQDTRVRVGP